MNGAALLPGLAGKRALVTGGSRGIGRATVRLLASCGASVGVAYRSADAEAEAAVREASEAGDAFRRDRGAAFVPRAMGVEQGTEPELSEPARFWCHAADLAVEDGARLLFDRVDEEFGRLDLFVGNAGIWNVEDVPIRELDAEAWRRMMAVNLDSIFYTTREAVRRMGRGGRIVLLSSTAGQRGEPGHDHYAASKGAIISFTKSLARELGPEGITVNAVAPGWVETDMSAPILEGAGSEEMERVLAEIPLRRVATAADVAGPIVFLLSDLGRQITGEVLNVNGGSVVCG
jgi:3-oxoacyl-[acyl-carrier protein] reductase